ncbi:MAG: TIGR03619 family F420-dependent LLM class oxidoreductase [Acidimicrobiia bacterium]
MEQELRRRYANGTIDVMEIGLVLPTIGKGANAAGIEAGAAIAARLGWSSVWVTDHLMVAPGPEADEYGTILEAVVALTYIAARFEDLTIGTSAIIPPLRNSVLLAKELATLDVLSKGRLVVGVGVADAADRAEFDNLGVGTRFEHRGDLVNETIALWRHLWSGEEGPFEGRFHDLRDYVFRPLPAQGGKLPIWTGGRSRRALVRAATLADGYHAAQTGPDDLLARIPELSRLSDEAGRPMPTLSVRARVRFDREPGAKYSMAGTRAEIAKEVERFAEAGAQHLVVVLEETEADRIIAAAQRFHDEAVVPAIGHPGGGHSPR